MARILLEDAFFEELAPGSMLETDFERVVREKGRLIFPDFFVVPFKCAVSSEEDSAKADLALVERSYREWWVVEVELGNHSFGGHVLPQVRTLAQAAYGEDEGRVLCAGCPDLRLGSVLDMVKGTQPRVLVVVDAERKDWAQALRNLDAEVLVLQIFRSDRNAHAFRIDGYVPTVRTVIASACSFDPLVPRFLVVHSPAVLGTRSGETLTIRYKQCTTEWQRVDGRDMVWLAPARQNPLPESERFQIVRHEDGSLEFEAVSETSVWRK